MLLQLLKRTLSPTAFSELNGASHLLRKGSYLFEVGWFESWRKQCPVDKSGKPVPWYTYPAISFLNDRLHSAMNVFEFGAGHSTLWYATKVNSVVSVEHNKKWHSRIAQDLPNNVTLIFRSLDDGYATAADGSFDLIAIDGENRFDCAKSCLKSLKDDGVIVLDNSGHPHNQPIFDLLSSLEFRRITFEGIDPCITWIEQTTIFYRINNCLSI